ncbi:hypothetical protein OCU04_012492 [Sclerotinia nivalis]|uniref:Uncharacterized protein n=1 Tax=Sclerotinia nivalis TaxID=352851 RepID=A0A9X0A9W9_9HELO|nr:hypothetical protein OCU04_012492 [Sclerotinia nivalis]
MYEESASPAILDKDGDDRYVFEYEVGLFPVFDEQELPASASAPLSSSPSNTNSLKSLFELACGPSINQLIARAIKSRSFSSLFTSRIIDTPGESASNAPFSKHDQKASGSAGFSRVGSSKNTPTSVRHIGSYGSTTAITNDSDYGVELHETDIPMDSMNGSRDINAARHEKSIV